MPTLSISCLHLVYSLGFPASKVGSEQILYMFLSGSPALWTPKMGESMGLWWSIMGIIMDIECVYNWYYIYGNVPNVSIYTISGVFPVENHCVDIELQLQVPLIGLLDSVFCCLHCQQITQTTLTMQSVFIYRVVLICFYSKPLTWLEDLQYDKDINWYKQHCQQQQNLKRLQLHALQYSVRSSTGGRTHQTRHLVISIPFHARAKIWISQNVKLFSKSCA